MRFTPDSLQLGKFKEKLFQIGGLCKFIKKQKHVSKHKSILWVTCGLLKEEVKQEYLSSREHQQKLCAEIYSKYIFNK